MCQAHCNRLVNVRLAHLLVLWQVVLAAAVLAEVVANRVLLPPPPPHHKEPHQTRHNHSQNKRARHCTAYSSLFADEVTPSDF